MGYDGILQFKGIWRDYQARVLKNAGKYMADGRIHIVAAPGSGKTTLGIELIRRMGQPALVLTPSVTIREQWASRIEEAFLCEGINAGDYISQDLKKPKLITIATYQALHSAISNFDLISTMRENCLGVLCLDECHHLRRSPTALRSLRLQRRRRMIPRLPCGNVTWRCAERSTRRLRFPNL